MNLLINRLAACLRRGPFRRREIIATEILVNQHQLGAEIVDLEYHGRDRLAPQMPERLDAVHAGDHFIGATSLIGFLHAANGDGVQQGAVSDAGSERVDGAFVYRPRARTRIAEMDLDFDRRDHR